MRLCGIYLKNFRPYRDETRIPIDDFTAFIGKNDIGKSCILEALEIFFNGALVKLDHDDATKPGGGNEIEIGCVFCDLPPKLVLDEKATTTLPDEFLLNSEGHLEIHRVFDCSTKKISDSYFAIAQHPTADKYNDLLLLKNADLKKRFESLNLADETVNKAINRSLRKAIWNSCPDLQLNQTRIPLDKEEAKRIWTALEPHMPLFALFQSDRPSKDDDSEVQDPMKAAIAAALKEQQAKLEEIKESIRTQAIDVATRTLDKLKEWDPELANTLFPNFRAEPKWDQIFKISLTGDDQIPINKRGSGVRRLILLSFFRAEAERRRTESLRQDLIYAIEEPETSQHPNSQRLLIEAFLDLSETNCQVFITTHNPALAAYVPTEYVRYIVRENGCIVVKSGDGVLAEVSRTLGVLPDSRINALVCVEGWSDIDFLRHASQVYSQHDPEVPDLMRDDGVAFIPLGGSNLQQWVDNRFLKGFGRPELHLYDRGSETPPTYQPQVVQLNAEGEDARLTRKREIENYLHRDAIQQVYQGIPIPAFTDTDNVPVLVAKSVYEADQGLGSWDGLDEDLKKRKISRVKYRMAKEAVPLMTQELLTQADQEHEIPEFLKDIGRKCREFAHR